MKHRMRLILILAGLCCQGITQAEVISTVVGEHQSYFTPLKDPQHPRGYLLMPTLSLALPGFDQWWEGDYKSAGSYSSLGILGFSYAASESSARKHEMQQPWHQGLSDAQKKDYTLKSVPSQKIEVGLSLYELAGGLSAYQAFRTAVASQQNTGKFGFLHKEETPNDLMAAPFHFSYLKRPTTFIPLLVAAGIAGLNTTHINSDSHRTSFSSMNAASVGSMSYSAGVAEEAYFRGYLMPAATEMTGSPITGNVMSSVVFGLCHTGPSNNLGMGQMLFGGYLGYLVQRNDWTLSEAVFVHAWWDVISLATIYQIRTKDSTARITPFLTPLATLSF